MKTTRYVTSALEQPARGKVCQPVNLEFEALGEPLGVHVGDQQWALRAVEARRSFVSIHGMIEPVTYVRTIVLGPAGAGALNLVVDCGATPPLLTVQSCGGPAPRIFVITHDQQDAILDVLERHIRAVGLPEIPRRQFDDEIRPAA